MLERTKASNAFADRAFERGFVRKALNPAKNINSRVDYVFFVFRFFFQIPMQNGWYCATLNTFVIISIRARSVWTF